jgi:hypothetical protein
VPPEVLALLDERQRLRRDDGAGRAPLAQA